MGVYPVTQAQYEQVMGANPSCFSKNGGGKDKVKGLDAAEFPVERVSWANANLFCEKLAAMLKEKEANRAYRLPTEAEWEYACRAGTKTAYHFGNSIAAARINFNRDLGRTCKVGSCKPNKWGLADMHGNVWQWCADWYDKDFYPKSPYKDPLCRKVGTTRVLRGGSWIATAKSCRSAARSAFNPASPTNYIGCRVVCVPGKTK